MSKFLKLLVAAVCVTATLSACSKASDAEVENTSVEASSEEVSSEFVLEYPADMQALGYSEPVVLEEEPKRVVSLSAAPVLALYNLGVNLVGVPNSMVVTWPEDLKNNAATVSFSVMSPDDFDAESVIALEPDLVFMAVNAADTAGATLEAAGINVYYLYAGHTVSYDSIKMQTQCLIDAFNKTEEERKAGEEILASFAELESYVDSAKKVFAGKKVMVLQSSGDSHYIQTNKGTLGSMAEMIGFENVYVNDATSMAQLDMESALEYQPDLVLCVGGTDAETHKANMEESYSHNEEYWNSIDAVKNGNVIYLDVTYCSTAGINVIDNIKNLIDICADFYGVSID